MRGSWKKCAMRTGVLPEHHPSIDKRLPQASLPPCLCSKVQEAITVSPVCLLLKVSRRLLEVTYTAHVPGCRSAWMKLSFSSIFR